MIYIYIHTHTHTYIYIIDRQIDIDIDINRSVDAQKDTFYGIVTEKSFWKVFFSTEKKRRSALNVLYGNLSEMIYTNRLFYKLQKCPFFNDNTSVDVANVINKPMLDILITASRIKQQKASLN